MKSRKKKRSTPLPPLKVYECWTIVKGGVRCATRMAGRVRPRQCMKCGGKLLYAD